MKKRVLVFSVIFILLLLSLNFVSAGFLDWFKQAIGLSPDSPGIILDNTDTQFTKVGSWSISSSTGFYGTNSLYSKTPSSTATWTFNNLQEGEYEVYEWHGYWASRPTNAPFSIYNGNTLLQTIRINQKDQTTSGKWTLLGKFTFGTTAKITLTVENASFSYNADAIKLVKTSFLN